MVAENRSLTVLPQYSMEYCFIFFLKGYYSYRTLRSCMFSGMDREIMLKGSNVVYLVLQ